MDARPRAIGHVRGARRRRRNIRAKRATKSRRSNGDEGDVPTAKIREFLATCATATTEKAANRSRDVLATKVTFERRRFLATCAATTTEKKAEAANRSRDVLATKATFQRRRRFPRRSPWRRSLRILVRVRRSLRILVRVGDDEFFSAWRRNRVESCRNRVESLQSDVLQSVA